MSYSICCDHCKAILKSPVPVPGGKKIKCPKCQQVFTSPAETPAVATADDDAPRITAIARATSIDPPPKPKAKPTPPAEPDEEIPEIDDDLVDPDDDDEPPAKKKRRDQDDDDDEDEEPRSKKRKRRDEEADEDEEDDGEPRSKKRKQRDEEDDDDDRPRKSAKKKKKAGSPLLLIGLIGGGVFALLLCLGCSIGGYLIFGGSGGPDIVGRWENDPNDPANILRIKMALEFRADGTGKQDILGIVSHFNYKFDGGDLVLSFTHTELGGQKLPNNAVVRARVTRTGDSLRIEDLSGANRGKASVYRKAG